MRTLALILLAATVAIAADTFTVLSLTEFEIPAIDIPAGGDQPDAKVAITPTVTLVLATDLLKNDKAPEIRATLANVSVGTVAHPEYAGAFEFEPFAAEGKKGDLRQLKVTVNRAKLPDPLTYVAKVLLARDGDPTVTPQALNLTFTRPAATVSVSPLRLENTRYFPVFTMASLKPGTLKVLETSRRATLINVQIQVKDYLKGPDDFSVPAQLKTDTIERIEAGKDGVTDLGVVGNLPLGSAKGTLIVRAGQLAQPAEVAIEIVTHTCRFWLLFTIALSIIGGYFFRTLPEKRLTEDQSRLAAEQQFGQIKQLLGNAVDPDLRDALQKILDTLKTAIEAKPFVAAKLDAAVKKAADDTDTELKNAETARAALRTRITDLRAKLDSPDDQPPKVAEAVSGLIARLQAQDSALKSGAVKSVQTELDNIDRQITKTLIPDTIGLWSQETHTALDRMGQWQGLEFETTRKSVFDETDPSKIPAIDLAKTRELARKLTIFVLGAGLRQATDLAGQALDQLNGLNLAGLKAKLDDARTALAEVRNLNNPTIAQLPEFGQKLGKLRGALIDAIQTASKLAGVAEPDGLDAGDFAKAMTALTKSLQSKEQALGARPAALPEPPPIEVMNTDSFVAAASAARPAGTTWWDLQLDAPVNPVAGEPAVANVTVIGASPGAIDMEWTIGNSIQLSRAGTQSFVPPAPGALAISVRGVARATGESHIASAIIQVRPQHGFPAVNQILAQQGKDELRQTIVSGFFILAAGYAIFQGVWSGTFMDFLAAALWGFSVDIGAAKVREIASPLLSRPVPLPASKQ